VRIFDHTLTTLERALDVRLARQTTLAANLANVDTPGFVPRDLDFAAAMGAADGAGPGAIPVPGADPSPAGGEMPLHLASWNPSGAGASPGPGPIPGPPGTLAGLAGGLSPSASTGQAVAPGIDGNAVDADRTLVALSENALQYGAAAKAVSKKLAILRYVASDGTA
jgi:flagellar basal-body rod protein FlgB